MTIASLFPCAVKNLLREIEELGFSLCLVGGAPRDFFMKNSLSTDLDFEIRNQDVGVLRLFFKNKMIKYSELPYQITRVELDDMDLEFSIPRIERQIEGNKTHHHFEAHLDTTLSYKDAFKRRDFTINAIGIELNISEGKEEVVDPYEGLKDLSRGILREISKDFYQDSVRFLRLIRFSIKYDFKINESITKHMGEFNLRELSKHHFTQEMFKSLDAGKFINKFNELVKAYKLSIPKEFEFWNQLNFSSELKTKDDFLVAVFFKKNDSAKEVANFFLMPEKKLKDLKSFYNSFKSIKTSSKIQLSELVKASINEFKEPGLLKDLKNLEDKKYWSSYFTEALPVSWSDWESVTVTSAELEAVPVAMRSYLRFYKALKQSVK